jgi:hypothetical protein
VFPLSNQLQFRLPTHHSWVKLSAVSAFTSLLPFGFLVGISALFGVNSVMFEGQSLVGWIGLFVGVAMAVFVAGLVTFFAASFGYFGLWLYSRFRPITLEYIPENKRRKTP